MPKDLNGNTAMVPFADEEYGLCEHHETVHDKKLHVYDDRGGEALRQFPDTHNPSNYQCLRSYSNTSC